MLQKYRQSIAFPYFDEDGKMNPALEGRQVTLTVGVGYPGSKVSDIYIGGAVFQISNKDIEKAMTDVPQTF